MSLSNYVVLGEIGRGKDTIVQKASNQVLNRIVALKTLNADAKKDKRRVDRFIREAQFLARFNHERVVQVYAVDQENCQIEMELMAGNLADQVEREAMDADLVRSVLAQSLDALKVIHEQNLIHGKIRPSNLLIDTDGFVKLSDFEPIEIGGELPAPEGDLKHIAPEILSNKFGKVGPAYDLYCLGFSCLELLVGPDFESRIPGLSAVGTASAWASWHSAQDNALNVQKLVPSIPPDLGQVLDALLAKMVEDRPNNTEAAKQLINDNPIQPIDCGDGVSNAKSTSRVEASKPAIADKANTSTEEKSQPVKEKKSGARKDEAKKNAWSHPLILIPLSVLVFLAITVPLIGPEIVGWFSPKTLSIRFLPNPAEGPPVKVFVDDQLIESDENGAYSITAEKHAFRFEREGYVALSGERELTKSQEVPINFSVYFTLTSNPTDLQLQVSSIEEKDGKTEETKCELTDGKYKLLAGTHRLKIKAEGFPEKELSINLSPEQNSFDVIFGIPVAIQFSQQINDVKVSINGKDPVDFEPDKLVVTPGQYDLSFSKEGYEFAPLEQVEVKEGMQPVEVSVTPLALVKFDFPEGLDKPTITANGDPIVLGNDGSAYVRPGEYEFQFAGGDEWKLKNVKQKITGKVTIKPDVTRLYKLTVNVEDADAQSIASAKISIGENKNALQREFRLPAGKYDVVVKDEGYAFKNATIEVKDKDVASTIKGIKLVSVAIKITPEVADAKIVRNGTDLSVDDNGIIRIPENESFDAQVVADGFDSKPLKIDPSIAKEYKVELVRSVLLPAGTIAAPGSTIDPKLKMPTSIIVTKTKDLEIPLKLVLIQPEENYVVGVASEESRLTGELGGKKANLTAPFYIGVTEVTNEQYSIFAGAQGEEESGTQWKNFQKADNTPVVGLTYDHASAFCKWANGVLPSETEWEAAARGDGKALFPWGENAPEDEKSGLANLFYGDQSKVQKVDSLPDGKSKNGLTHMVGNVWEICRDDYRPGTNQSENDIKGGSKVMRGGSFSTVYTDARLTTRMPFENEGKPDVGFRLLIPAPK